MSQTPPQMPPFNPYNQPPQPMSPADEKLWATLIHIGGILFYVIVPLIGYLVLKDRGPFVRGHATTALNFHLTIILEFVVVTFVSVITFGLASILYLPILIIVIVFGIIAAVAANKGQVYYYPLTIPFVR